VPALSLRDVVDDDLSVFFEHQCDPEANYMAAFTAKDPGDRAAFLAHWERIRRSPTVMVRTIADDVRDFAAGHPQSDDVTVLCFVRT